MSASIEITSLLDRLKEALLTSADGEASPKLEEILSAELVARPKVRLWLAGERAHFVHGYAHWYLVDFCFSHGVGGGGLALNEKFVGANLKIFFHLFTRPTFLFQFYI
jgi:hypothetical protein